MDKTNEQIKKEVLKKFEEKYDKICAIMDNVEDEGWECLIERVSEVIDLAISKTLKEVFADKDMKEIEFRIDTLRDCKTRKAIQALLKNLKKHFGVER